MNLFIAYLGTYVIAILFGIVIGSFLNVVIYRVPLHINIAKGRSFCPNCKHSLHAVDLVPVFSYIFLREKCRYCGNHISLRYPLVEILGGIAAATTLYFYWISFEAFVVFLIICLLIVITFIDIDTQTIPDVLNVILFGLSIVYSLLATDLSWIDRGIGVFAVALPMLIITMIIPGAFGGGDIKLCAAVGGFLGWKLMLLAGFIAILTGGIYGVYLLATKKKDKTQHFAFGPFLAVGMILSTYIGNDIISWYLSMFVL